MLEDHRDNYRHPRPAERGRSAISLGLSQSAALNATAAGIREPWHPNNALHNARQTRQPHPVTMEPLQRKPKPHPRAWARAAKAFHAQNAAELDEDWLGRFAELLTYRQRKGTFAAPPDTELGRWIKHQRQQHASNKLPVAARARLAGCGFFEPQPLMDASRPLTSGTALRAEQHARLRPGTSEARPRITSRPSFDRPGTAASPDPRVRVTSWGDAVSYTHLTLPTKA